MRRNGKKLALEGDLEDMDRLPDDSYFTYRPLSNLPTPPPSSRQSSTSQICPTTLDDGEALQPKFRGEFVYEYSFWHFCGARRKEEYYNC